MAHPQKLGMNSSLDHPQGASTSDTIHSEFHEAYLQEKKKKLGNFHSQLCSLPPGNPS